MTNPNQFQQGDILFLKVEKIPAHFTKQKGDKIVAYGEHSGHAHLLVGDEVEILLADLETQAEIAFTIPKDVVEIGRAHV